MSGLAIILNSLPDTDIISFVPDSSEEAPLQKSCYRTEVDRLRRLLCEKAASTEDFHISEVK